MVASFFTETIGPGLSLELIFLLLAADLPAASIVSRSGWPQPIVSVTVHAPIVPFAKLFIERFGKI